MPEPFDVVEPDVVPVNVSTTFGAGADDGFAQEKIPPEIPTDAGVAVGVGVGVGVDVGDGVGVGVGRPLTAMQLENSEVFPFVSVAVAVTTEPKGRLAGKTTLKVPVHAPLVLATVDPR